MAARINPTKVKQEADKLEKSGRLEQAISLYRQVVDDNPTDWNTINKVGDLYAKLNRNREAAGEYAKVADYYARDGFLLKAIAIWKKINKLDSSALEPYTNLAELYAKQGLMMEAKGQYQIIVDEYVRRGKLKDAGDILRRMAEIDPSDLKIRSKLADLYTREGNSAKAIDEHIAIADELNKKGHLAEALQVLEKGLKIGPQNPRLRAELARIHLLQKNYDRAVHFLEEAAQHAPNDTALLSRLGEAYLGAKKIEEAQAIFRRLLELNPGDQDSRVQMGRLCLIQGQFDRALDELSPVIDNLIQQRDAERAVALLQQVLQRNPNHIRSLAKLGEIYRATGKESLTAATYSQLTEAYLKERQFQRAAEILEQLVSIEPQNQQHRTKLDFVRREMAGGTRPPVAAAPPASFELEEEFDLDQPVVAPRSAPATAAPPAAAPARAARAPQATPIPRPVIELSGQLSPEDREFIDEHMAEGRVFRKYGLADKALDQFEAIVARFADHVEARRELVDLYKERGPQEKAAEHGLALAEALRLRGDASAAQAIEMEFRGRAPSAGVPAPAAQRAPAAPAPRAHEEIPIDIEELGVSPPASAPAGESDLGGLDFGLEGEELPDRFLEEAPSAEAEEFDVSLPIEPAPPAGTPLNGLGALLPPSVPSPAFTPSPEPVSFEDDLLGSLPPPVSIPAPAPARQPHARATRPTTPPTPLSPLEEILGGALPPAPTAPAPDLPPDLARVLADVDQSLAFGFVDEAKEALRNVGRRHPGHPAILEKIELLGLDQVAETGVEETPFDLGSLGLPSPSVPGPLDLLGDAPSQPVAPRRTAPSAPARRAAAPASEPFDLGAELDDLFGAQPAVEGPASGTPATELGDPSLVRIFEEFKKGVDQQLGKEDYDTRYNLGIAYKEMGLVDEAISEFQLAAKDDSRMLECASMLGLCFMEKGMPKLAVKWFEKGLATPGRLEEEYHGLRYDLALAHESAGETDAALRVFMELYSLDASFRDVATRVRDLRASLGR